MSARVGWVVLIFLGGCGLNEVSYNKKVSTAFCKWEKRCEQADFYANFANIGACEEAQRVQLDNLQDYYDAKCLFDADNARACLKALGSSCKEAGEAFEELFQPCYQVYACAEDFEAATDTEPLF